MGYYTDYNLTIIWDDPAQVEGNADLYAERVDGGFVTIDALVGEGYNSKWYEYESDMIALSLKYPTYTFKLEGFGGDHGDEWTRWFRKGLYAEVKRVAYLPEWLDIPTDGWKAPKVTVYGPCPGYDVFEGKCGTIVEQGHYCERCRQAKQYVTLVRNTGLEERILAARGGNDDQAQTRRPASERAGLARQAAEIARDADTDG